MTEEEIEEQWAFLDAICDTEVMKYTHQWLVNKDLAPEDMDDFKEALNNIWFNMYGRYVEGSQSADRVKLNSGNCGFFALSK